MTGTCFDSSIGERYALYHGDCVLALPGLPDYSIGLSVSSWPFSDQYAYSPAEADFGNCDGDDDFFAQCDYLLPELLRVTIPGRFAIVHCKDRIIYGSRNNGVRHIEPFSDKVTTAMRRHGWLFYGRITIATDPVRENNQTNNLPYSELKKDASRYGVGMPEYLLLFRRPHTPSDGGQWSDARVTLDEAAYPLPRWQLDANSVWRTSGAWLPPDTPSYAELRAELKYVARNADGTRDLLPYEIGGYNYQAHVEYLMELDRKVQLGRAHGQPLPTDNPWVWWDIQRIKVLNGQVAKEAEDAKHICPLQLDLIERCITRWSNPGDVVLDYFTGIGSVPWRALQLGRRGVGIELKASYYRLACQFLSELEFQQMQPTMFPELEVA
jgi:DNA modification methylase